MKPEFFKHSGLYQAEVESGLPLRLAFEGLWTVADREGRFKWKPPELKLEVLPYDPVDFGEILEALSDYGFIRRYVVDGKEYGVIDSFRDHQPFHPREAQSTLPVPPKADPAVQLHGEAVQSPPASTSVSTSTSASASKDVANATGEPVRKGDLGELMGAIRTFGYRERTARKDEFRDHSVARAMLAKHPLESCLQAVEGTRLLVDAGRFGSTPAPGGHFTLRLVWYAPKGGGQPVFCEALDAYYAGNPGVPRTREHTQPTGLVDDMDRILKNLAG